MKNLVYVTSVSLMLETRTRTAHIFSRIKLRLGFLVCIDLERFLKICSSGPVQNVRGNSFARGQHPCQNPRAVNDCAPTRTRSKVPSTSVHEAFTFLFYGSMLVHFIGDAMKFRKNLIESSQCYATSRLHRPLWLTKMTRIIC